MRPHAGVWPSQRSERCCARSSTTPSVFLRVPMTGRSQHHRLRRCPQSTSTSPKENPMLTDERRQELSDVLRPVAPPREITDVYTADQRERLLDVVRTQGPWKLIIAQHFASADELMATMSGAFPEGFEPTLDLFLTPTF